MFDVLLNAMIETALQEAASREHTELVQRLLEAGAVKTVKSV
ncbi:MAG: ankyrin repeat domain-containing protein [Treponema sp.]|nr:ankyrin repeat domain-containing protein [Treponema sp.]